MRRYALVSLFALCSCAGDTGNGQAWLTPEQRFNQAVAACDSTPLTRKTAIQRVDCVSNVRTSMSQQADYPYPSLIYQINAANKTAAVAYSEGKISKASFEAAIEQNKANFYTAEEQYSATAQQRRAAAYQGLTNAGLGMMQQAQQPAYAPNVTTTNCRNTAAGLSCTTW